LVFFWPQEAKKKKAKKSKNSRPPYEKFDILDETKHIHENFDILYFTVPKLLHFAFYIP
jgi:hypothetical protein